MGVAHKRRTLPQRTYRRPIQKRVPARHEGNLQAQQATGTLRLVEQHLQSAHIQLHDIQSAYLFRKPTLAPRTRTANLNISKKIMADRHQFRANWHDYNGGIYFVTICSCDKKHIFGEIDAVGTRLIASTLGSIIEEAIQKLPTYYNDVNLLNHVVMPNHVHMVLSVGARLIASAETLPSSTSFASSSQGFGCINPPRHGVAFVDNHHNSRLASIIGAFKAGVTRTARTRLIASLPCWQSRYHEHIIRNQYAFDNIMSYIDSNIERWNTDCFNNHKI